ncbi:MAG: DUF4976 domain-containing protein, partial [Lentisphaeraceae bacterium]|nr:DUF4976 domain-containing protein [Lentisphaeraceae bacterium]
RSGKDITPLLQNPQKEWNYPVLMTYTKHSYGEETYTIPKDEDLLIHKTGVPWWSSITQGRYKYIHYLIENERAELYDLEKDPEELNNLGLNPEYKSLIQSYQETMKSELKRTKAKFLEDLPTASFK